MLYHNIQLNHAVGTYISTHTATGYSISCSSEPCQESRSGNLLPGLQVWTLCVGHKPAAEFTLRTERLSGCRQRPTLMSLDWAKNPQTFKRRQEKELNVVTRTLLYTTCLKPQSRNPNLNRELAWVGWLVLLQGFSGKQRTNRCKYA